MAFTSYSATQSINQSPKYLATVTRSTLEWGMNHFPLFHSQLLLPRSGWWISKRQSLPAFDSNLPYLLTDGHPFLKSSVTLSASFKLDLYILFFNNALQPLPRQEKPQHSSVCIRARAHTKLRHLPPPTPTVLYSHSHTERVIQLAVTDQPPSSPSPHSLGIPALPTHSGTHSCTLTLSLQVWLRWCDNYLGWQGLGPMRRGTLRGGYVLEEGKASCYSSTPSQEAKQNKQKIKASIDVSHNFWGWVVGKNAQGKCLLAELISMDRMTC